MRTANAGRATGYSEYGIRYHRAGYGYLFSIGQSPRETVGIDTDYSSQCEPKWRVASVGQMIRRYPCSVDGVPANLLDYLWVERGGFLHKFLERMSSD